MCRLYGFRANEPTQVECTLLQSQNALLKQSRKDALRRSNADGRGIAYYDGETPVVERHDAPAFSDPGFAIAAQSATSRTVVAHVRAASVGMPTIKNTHPFRFGNWVFAHNGTVSRFDQLSDQLARETPVDLESRRSGTTDSEQSFIGCLAVF